MRTNYLTDVIVHSPFFSPVHLDVVVRKELFSSLNFFHPLLIDSVRKRARPILLKSSGDVQGGREESGSGGF